MKEKTGAESDTRGSGKTKIDLRNPLTDGLGKNSTRMLAVLVEDISDPYFSAVARVMEEKAYEYDCKILFGSTENNLERTDQLIRLYKSRGVDGYVIAPPPGADAIIGKIMSEGYPVVLFDRVLPISNVNAVITDNLSICYKAVKHLIDNGYRNIAFFTLESGQSQMLERLRGYCQAVNENELPQIVKKVMYHDIKENVITEMEGFLKNNPAIDALFFATNHIAYNGLAAIRNLNLKVNEDVALLAFDDVQLFNLFSPPISAIAQPVKQIGLQSMELITQLFSQKDQGIKTTGKVIVIPAKLIIRTSTKSKGAIETAHLSIINQMTSFPVN
ncbi:substrate-binding domain-containing protein [Mucilaginibacter sp. SJ]|uniref:substrate-binding domain-containing protein n=1 Tax=Mucilaginibacter sp. SJ TaxID=3029053 RepID=UPI0023A93368|nr:substrate-binding domain-containing protein [Mucilaginibacter sp. SJ]WEA00616.1 substrate-binding domain-containing protein [Mucilaginibacter sp. SJ]